MGKQHGSDLRKFLNELKEMGWSSEKTAKGHYRLIHATHGIVIFPGTSVSSRGLLNAKSIILRKMREDGSGTGGPRER